MKNFLLILFPIIIFGCSNNEKKIEVPEKYKEAITIFPVTEFIKGQLKQIDSLPITPLQIKTKYGISDSVWLDRKQIRDFVWPFLTPVIDSVTLSKYYNGKSFLDQTINAFTLTYDANKELPDSIDLRLVDVYIDPKTNIVERIYMVKESSINGVPVTTQLTWKVNEWYSIRTITQPKGGDPEIQELKIVWGF